MDIVVDTDAEKQMMVQNWATALKEMPETDYATRELEDLESACAGWYDAYMAAMQGDGEQLRRFVKRVADSTERGTHNTGELLRGLWAFREVAVARSWTFARLVNLDEVIYQATVGFAEACDEARTGDGYLSVMKSLAVALDSKDKYTSSHCQAVQRVAEVIAADVGTEIGYAGLLHDVGKIHVPDHILQKPGKLTPAEYDVVKQHSVHSYRILSPLPAPLPSLVLQHHERPDGRGYPLGITEVSMPAAIVAVADTLHAIVSERPYSAARPFDEAMEIINEVKGTQLREEPVEALNRVKEAVREDILREMAAGAS